MSFPIKDCPVLSTSTHSLPFYGPTLPVFPFSVSSHRSLVPLHSKIVIPWSVVAKHQPGPSSSALARIKTAKLGNVRDNTLLSRYVVDQRRTVLSTCISPAWASPL